MPWRRTVRRAAPAWSLTPATLDAFQTITIGGAAIRHLRINRSGEVMALCEVVRDRAHSEHPPDTPQREASAKTETRPGAITCQRCRTALGLTVSR